jgi:hypothetical protein
MGKKRTRSLFQIHDQQLQPNYRLAGRLKMCSNTAKPVTALAFTELTFNGIACGCIRSGDFLLLLLIR